MTVTFTVPDVLWHYTCRDHGGAEIGEAGTLRPGYDGLVWLTDLEVPHIEALGLVPVMARCNRAELRYRVTDMRNVYPWMEFRRGVETVTRWMLEGQPGVMPRHWFVNLGPVDAVLDPL